MKENRNRLLDVIHSVIFPQTLKNKIMKSRLLY